MPEPFRPHLAATGIGSLPHDDPALAVADVLARLTGMPYWPQLPRRSPLEDMNLQYASALRPLLAADEGARSLLAHPRLSREEALAQFYQRLLAGPEEDFGLDPAEAAGFFAFLEAVEGAPRSYYPWVKGHVTGPLTLAAAVLGADGKAMLYDEEMAEAIARGLGAAAAAQVHQLEALERPIMIFVDEPFLAGYGSAFNPLSRERAIALLAACLEECRQRAKAVMGVHCCGNTDWSILIDAGFDVINLDSAGYGRHLLLYPEALKKFYARGGVVAWGAVPTSGYTGRETAAGLWASLRGLLDELEAQGLARADLADQALVTPACGLGSLEPETACAILELTRDVSALARREFV